MSDATAYSQLQSIDRAMIDINQGNVFAQVDLDLDLSPGTGVGGSPHLTYNSGTTHVRPIVQSTIHGLPTSGWPTVAPLVRVESELYWADRKDPIRKTIDVPSGASNADFTVSVQLYQPVRETGVYDWRMVTWLTFELSQGETIRVQSVQTGKSTVLVNDTYDRTASPQDPADEEIEQLDAQPFLGAGWSLDLLSRVQLVDEGSLLWISGNGDVRRFASTSAPANPFGPPVPPPLQRKYRLDDSLVGREGLDQTDDWEGRQIIYDTQDREYRLVLRNGTEYRYDRQGLLTKIVPPTDEQMLFEYDNGKLTHVTAPDGSISTFHYDAFGYLDRIEDRLGATSDTVLTALPAIWNGQRQDIATGLYGTGSQVYDPLAARYITQAAPATDPNPYRYDNGDPVNDGRTWVDHWFIDPGAQIGFGFADAAAFGRADLVYGQASADVNRGTALYYGGMAVGVAGSIWLGNWAGATAAAGRVGSLAYVGARAYQAYSIAGDVVGVYDSYQGVSNGDFSAMNLLAFAPTIGWASKGLVGIRALGSFPEVRQFAQELWHDIRFAPRRGMIDLSAYGEGYDRIFGGKLNDKGISLSLRMPRPC